MAELTAEVAAERAKKLSKYLEHLYDMVDNVLDDLLVVSRSLEEAKKNLKEADALPVDGEWNSVTQRISRNLSSCMPHTGINLANFMLELNGRVSNIPLLVQDPMRDLNAQEIEPQ